ncbi:MAG: PaeR7I family type II restriction endonuclease [Deltaproteobacteria bacterium]|nr:PaeR7I family type II restriction endonuclease [Deltaproteobacteria bacterium]
MAIIDNIDKYISKSVAHYWRTRRLQRERQKKRGVNDAGLRSAVTGGAQMDGFIDLFTRLIVESGIKEEYVFYKRHIELPGFFRPTKEWDLLVIKDGCLVVAIEAKSQVGPSFGNNFNNRTEEAMGSALDLWTAFREGAFNGGRQPFLGYFFMLEDCEASNRPVRVKEPHFKVFPEFVGASYLKRYEIFCRKLVLERHYTASSFIVSDSSRGEHGTYREPADDLSFKNFAKTLSSHVRSFI